MKKLLYFTVFFLSLSCSEKKAEYAGTDANDRFIAADSTAAPSAAQPESEQKPIANYAKGRKFIRTAEMDFRVKDVQKATNRIEDLSKQNGGMVTSVNLVNSVVNVDENPISADSTLELTSYEIRNDITIRVPNERLDTLIRSIQPLIDFLTYCKISAEDVSLTLSSNDQRNKDLAEYNIRMKKAIDEKGKRLNDIDNSEDNRLSRKMEASEVQAQNNRLNDQVNFSTLNIHIAQRISLRKEVIANATHIEALRPNLFVRLWDSFKTGWSWLEELLVQLMKLWFIWILIAGGAFWMYKRRGKS